MCPTHNPTSEIDLLRERNNQGVEFGLHAGKKLVMSAPPDPLDIVGRPAAHLLGLELVDGWRVIACYTPPPGSTGGTFSIGYIAERSVDQKAEYAFVKALDFSRWSELGIPQVDAINIMTGAYIFERDVVVECATRRMSNVVRGIGHGEIEVGNGPIKKVSYLIFERADDDVRTRLDAMAVFDVAWALRVLHHVANGLRQLHGAGIAHQDVKPSNVLMFPEASKLGDLGRAFHQGKVSPHSGLPIQGDSLYAPPECLYGFNEPDNVLRSREADAYHLGSMIMFMFAKVGATLAMLTNHLDPAFRPGVWAGTFDQVLPHVRAAFDEAILTLESLVPDFLCTEVSVLVRQLCDPEPAVRGNPKVEARNPRRYSMEYYVSKLDNLARKAELELRGTL